MRELISNLNALNELDATAVETDDYTQYTLDDLYKYSLVIDPRFQNWGDSFILMDDTLTSECANKYYPGLANPSGDPAPAYLYLQEEGLPTGLYAIEGGKGLFIYDTEATLSFEEFGDGYFVVSLPYDFLGETRTLTLEVVDEDGEWRINDISKGY